MPFAPTPPFGPSELFSCCTDHKPPKWSDYDHLELGGCRDHGGSTEGGVAFYAAEFFTVYGRKRDGEAEPITDIHDHREVLQIAAELAIRSGMQLIFYRPGGE